ncbi:hypothetical protein Pmar_PMAR022990 [Perkinsus marinus ATCC 50983]|uniref:Uncharacterized protein n=1 Tax=Perkinsus marinus (strain ATCC 50983 / TXsc) TaxID=423536 RepID=C5LHT9_PERM5|nr:hypothetical protein Pmar_PMAR022990 [Perkinsus marinus ATCC 50983]EER03693.1 hypothetical protein Pmar_PMAR022990 [Perkinsus marinus ATCC 50983]|eukprot:XP_002771877.1 hypothetical protein Pmar_PMAR022990 [Perkinsus marinus ATCC 50983]
MAANDSAEALARKTGVGDTGQNYDGDYHHEKGPKEVTCEHRQEPDAMTITVAR